MHLAEDLLNKRSSNPAPTHPDRRDQEDATPDSQAHPPGHGAARKGKRSFKGSFAAGFVQPCVGGHPGKVPLRGQSRRKAKAPRETVPPEQRPWNLGQRLTCRYQSLKESAPHDRVLQVVDYLYLRDQRVGVKARDLSDSTLPFMPVKHFFVDGMLDVRLTA